MMNSTQLIPFLNAFNALYEQEEAALPYHINVIDELHADENAHSRIFSKLLGYKENGKYPILEKFLNEVCCFNLTIEKPDIRKVDSCGRIDIPIFDTSYVVVIENKVTNKAQDQNKSTGGQLARYIETMVNDYGRKEDAIYVIYMPKYTRDPSDESWINKNNHSYKKAFEQRFRSISYRDRIYPWIKNELLPVIDTKDIDTKDKDTKGSFLRSAIEQYIDHLEGLFSLRKIDEKMNKNLQDYLKETWKINDEYPIEASAILGAKERELTNILDQVHLLQSTYNKQFITKAFDQWKTALQHDYPSHEVVGDAFNLNSYIINIGLSFQIQQQSFVALIECNDWNKPNLYIGIGRHFVSPKKHNPSPALQTILENHKLEKPEDYWYGWHYTSLDEAYEQLTRLIDAIIETIEI